jgi:hypothetical protein
MEIQHTRESVLDMKRVFLPSIASRSANTQRVYTLEIRAIRLRPRPSTKFEENPCGLLQADRQTSLDTIPKSFQSRTRQNLTCAGSVNTSGRTEAELLAELKGS